MNCPAWLYDLNCKLEAGHVPPHEAEMRGSTRGRDQPAGGTLQKFRVTWERVES